MGRRSSSDSEESSRKGKSSGLAVRHRRRTRSRSSTRSSSSDSSSSRNRRRSLKSRNRSKSPSGGSRSRNRRSRSRSESFDRYPRGSRSKRSSRNRRSRSRSVEPRQRSRQSRSPSIQEIFVKIEKPDVSKTTVVKNELTERSQKSPEEQLKIKMQMALKAAADADAMLREKGVLSAVKQERGTVELEKTDKPKNPLSMSEQINRAETINEINSDGFRQQEFKSGRSITVANSTQNSQIDDHDIIIFGTNAETNVLTGSPMQTAAMNPNKLGENLGQVAHENLYADVAAKQERWTRRLYSLRQKKLNGEAMV